MEAQKENMPRRDRTEEENAEASEASVSVPSRLRSFAIGLASRLPPREPTVPAGKRLPSSVEGLEAPPSAKEGQAARETESHWTAAGKRSCFSVNRGLPRSPLSAIDCTREREKERERPAALGL